MNECVQFLDGGRGGRRGRNVAEYLAGAVVDDRITLRRAGSMPWGLMGVQGGNVTVSSRATVGTLCTRLLTVSYYTVDVLTVGFGEP